MATRELGSLPRCRPARPQDANRRQAARDRCGRFSSECGTGLTERKAVTWPGSVRARHGADRAGTNPRSISSSSTRRRMSGSPNCGSSPRWPQTARTVCSLPAISVSGFFSSRSHGGLSASMCAAGLTRCGSTTEPRTRSVFRPIGCCRQPSPMWMAMPRTGAAPCRCSTGRPRRSRPARTRSEEARSCRRMDFRPGQSRGWAARDRRVRPLEPRAASGPQRAIRQAGIQAVELSDKIEVTPASSRSARCIWRRDWSFAPSR